MRSRVSQLPVRNISFGPIPDLAWRARAATPALWRGA
jgi:hypothetical protein